MAKNSAISAIGHRRVAEEVEVLFAAGFRHGRRGFGHARISLGGRDRKLARTEQAGDEHQDHRQAEQALTHSSVSRTPGCRPSSLLW
jgi:hypothetical protein